MAIRIGPDRLLASAAKPRGSQPTAGQQGTGQRAAARRTEQRRDRESEDSRRDAEDRARDAVSKASADVEDLGDFEDDELTDDDYDDFGLAPGDSEQAPASPSRPGGEARPSTPPPAETEDPLDEGGELTDADLGPADPQDDDDQGRRAPTTRKASTDELPDLSRRAMNDADTIAERDWLSDVAGRDERGELRTNPTLGRHGSKQRRSTASAGCRRTPTKPSSPHGTRRGRSASGRTGWRRSPNPVSTPNAASC